ncbi:inositol monophosphatase family protein [Streptosporangium sp. NPDC000396]|uniref:inositol monophosphatase family protein n=1 Tax=Streptosporangium sp. NPDC000396 TaxID=3366185 RepID=UPI0036ADA42C
MEEHSQTLERIFGEQRRGKGAGRLYTHVLVCSRSLTRPIAAIEFAKGFAIWDLAPGHYILNAAGGVVLDLQGRPISLDYGFGTVADIRKAMKQPQEFVAASSLSLAQDVLAAMAKA